jgi:hypothetical protein
MHGRRKAKRIWQVIIIGYPVKKGLFVPEHSPDTAGDLRSLTARPVVSGECLPRKSTTMFNRDTHYLYFRVALS